MSLEYLTDFSVKEEFLKAFTTMSWKSSAVIFFCVLLVQFGQHNSQQSRQGQFLAQMASIATLKVIHMEVLQCPSSFFFSRKGYFFFIQVTANRKSEGEPQAGTNTDHPSPTERGEVVLHPFPIKMLQHPRGRAPSSLCGMVGSQPAAPQPSFPYSVLGRMQAEWEDELLAPVAAAMVGV